MVDAWYRLLPFQFDRMSEDRYLCSSMAGDHVIIARATLTDLIHGTLDRRNPDVDSLVSALFMATDRSLTEIDLIANRLRTSLYTRSHLAGLHIVVTTLRCANACRYCQVSHVHPEVQGKDMSLEDADRVVELIHASPSPSIKIEFQGGEPLLNMPVVERILEGSERAKAASGKDVSYVIATSLYPLKDADLDLFRRFRVAVSTSLDGPADLHDANRPTNHGSSFARTVEGIQRCRTALGNDQVSALLTTTRGILDRIEDVVDSYVDEALHSIFIRWLNPFGHAVQNKSDLAYGVPEWLSCWRRGLDRVLYYNHAGYPIREEFAGILLKRMLSPFPVGFVDLDNPTGSGTSVLVYDYDGNVYISDEARMLAATGDQTFCIGSVRTHDFPGLMRSSGFQEMVSRTMLEATPRCSGCACRPWCGVDPVVNYTTQGDAVGYRPTSDHCHRMEGAFHHLVDLLNGPDREILYEWGLS